MPRWIVRIVAFVAFVASLELAGPALLVRVVAPAIARQDPQTITVYITRTGEKYHRDGCRYLRQSRIPTTLREAVRNGYDPCSVCKPPVLR